MLNVRQLEAFRATLRSGNVTRASRALNISQPSVTRLIADLEKAVGFTLFHRHRRGVTATPEALSLNVCVERSLIGLADIEDAARSIRDGSEGRLSIGVSAALALDFVPRVVASVANSEPQVEVSMHVSDSDRLIERLRDGVVSLAVMTPDVMPADLQVVLERSFPYVAVMRKDHSLSSRKGVLTVDHLRGEDTILPERGFLRAKCDDPATVEKLEARRGATAAASYPAVALVRHGLGVALIDPFTARAVAQDHGLIVKEFEDAPRFDLTVAVRGLVPLNPIQQRFLEIAATELTLHEPSLGATP